MVLHNYIASCRCSFLGSGFEFCLSLISTKVTLLEPEVTALLGGIGSLHLLGQRLEDGSGGGSNWELKNSTVLLNVGQSRR